VRSTGCILSDSQQFRFPSCHQGGFTYCFDWELLWNDLTRMFQSGEQWTSNPAIITWLAGTNAPKHAQGAHTNCVTVCSFQIIRECMGKTERFLITWNAARNIYIEVQNKHNRTSSCRELQDTFMKGHCSNERIQSETSKRRDSYRPAHETPAVDDWSLDCWISHYYSAARTSNFW